MTPDVVEEKAFYDENYPIDSLDKQQPSNDDTTSKKSFTDDNSNGNCINPKVCGNKKDGDNSGSQTSRTHQGQDSSSPTTTAVGGNTVTSSSQNDGSASGGDGGDERKIWNDKQSGHYEDYEENESGEEEAPAPGENKRIMPEIQSSSYRRIGDSSDATRAEAKFRKNTPRNSKTVAECSEYGVLQPRSSDQREEIVDEDIQSSSSGCLIVGKLSSNELTIEHATNSNKITTKICRIENGRFENGGTADQNGQSNTSVNTPAITNEVLNSPHDQNKVARRPEQNIRPPSGHAENIPVCKDVLGQKRGKDENCHGRKRTNAYTPNMPSVSEQNSVFPVPVRNDRTRLVKKEPAPGTRSHELGSVCPEDRITNQQLNRPAAERQIQSSSGQEQDKRDTTPADFTDGKHRPLPSRSENSCGVQQRGDTSSESIPIQIQAEDDMVSSRHVAVSTPSSNPRTTINQRGPRYSDRLFQEIIRPRPRVEYDRREDEETHIPREKCVQCLEYISNDHLCPFNPNQRATGTHFGGRRAFFDDPNPFYER